MVWKPLATYRRSAGAAARTGGPHLATAVWPQSDLRGERATHSISAPAGRTRVLPHDDRPSDRRRLYGRLAALFFAGAGVVGLVTLPLPAPGSNAPATAAVSAVALALGIAIWFAPWERWPRRASLVIVPPAFALIAVGNTFGGQDVHTYGVFFVVAFVWIGMAHPPRTSAAMAPAAAAAYVLPLFFLPGSVGAGLASAAIAIPVCVLVGEGIAWGVGRLEQIELALARERDRAEQLRELDEMKDRFLSAVSHELRTPITICRGHLEVLGEGADEREVRAVKAMCVSELALMGRLVEDLTTLAWADGRPMLRWEAVPLDSFLREITAKARSHLGGPGAGSARHRRRDAARGPPEADPGHRELAAECRRPRQRGQPGMPSGAGRAGELAFRGGRRGRGTAARRGRGGLRAVSHRVIARRDGIGAVHRPRDRQGPWR